MKTKQTFPLLLVIGLLISSNLFAQSKIDERFTAFSQLLSPEKLYLQTDKETYCVGDTLWFKGYLVNNSLISEFPESNFIYVELLTYYYNKNVYSNRIEETVRTVQRVKVKRRNGILQGYIVLDSDMNTGISILRGYTYWGLNFPTDYIFTRRIMVINPIKDNFVKDLVEHKVNETIEYTKVGVQNPFKKEKVRYKLDCQFLPESGRYFASVKTKMGVKSVNEEGFGEKVTGEVFSSDGQKVTEFETNDLGMGSFTFTAEPRKKYYAQVIDNRGIGQRVDLPEPSNSGAQINVTRKGDNFIAELYATDDLNHDSLRFILSNGTEIFYNGDFNKSTKVALPVLKMAEGVNVATIADNQGNIYAKRPLFVLPAEDGQVDIKTDKESYSQRELVTCTIDLNKPVSGDFSVSVTDNNHAPYTGLEDNIVSYMLLSSEIKGYVENPQHYFDRSIPLAEREKEVDLMMMTQGWQYYDLPAIFKAQFELPQYGKEFIQTISGRVKKSSLRRGKSSIVSFVAPSIGFTAMGQLDSSGFFELRDIDFPDSTLFIVNAVGINGNRKSFIPSITEDSFAPLIKYNRHKQKINYSEEDAQYMIQNYYNTGGDKVYQLDPVYVTSQRMVKANDNLSPFPVQYFKQGQLKTEEDLKPFIGYDLMTYIIETCQGIRFSTDTVTGERKLVSRVAGIASNWEVEDKAEVIVYINGIQAQSSSELDHYNVDELEAFVHLQGNDAAPFVPMMDGSASIRRVIMIKTKPSAKTGMPKNVTKGYPMGWQRPKSFYSPAYEVYGKGLVRYGADKRSTIYWNPNIRVEEGKAGFRFNTSDGDSNYTVVLEGITKEGEYIFQKAEIKRKKN